MVLNPTSGFQPGDPTKGLGIPRESDLEGQWNLITRLPQDWGKWRLQSGRSQTKSCVHKTQRKTAVTHRRLKQNCLLVLGVSCAGVGQQKLPTGSGEEAAAVSEGPPWCKRSWRSPVTRPRAHRPKGWVGSGQKTTREGTQPHLSAGDWIKAVLSKALPTRARPVFPTTSPSHQEAYTSLLASSISRQTEEARRTTVPQQLKQKPH